MIDKRVSGVAAALEDLESGARVMVNGFGGAGLPIALVKGLGAGGAGGLTIIANTLRMIESHAPELFAAHRVTGAIASAARSRGEGTAIFEQQIFDGALACELVPQGSFVERIRAGGAGIPAFYTPTGVGTELAEGREVREFDGRPCVLETAIRADFALLRADRADRWGNVACAGSQLNFAHAMASAATVTVVEVHEISAEPLPPHGIDIPGIFVQRIVEIPREDSA